MKRKESKNELHQVRSDLLCVKNQEWRDGKRRKRNRITTDRHCRKARNVSDNLIYSPEDDFGPTDDLMNARKV
jgi:hypothetical protein